MSVPGAKVPTARILVVGVCGIGVLNCGFSCSVCSATVTSLFRRCVARWTPCHEAQRVANAAAIFMTYARVSFGIGTRQLTLQGRGRHSLSLPLVLGVIQRIHNPVRRCDAGPWFGGDGAMAQQVCVV